MPRRKRATAEPQQNEFTTKSKRPRLPTSTSATRTQEPAITPAPIKTRASRSKSLNSPFNHKQCLSWFREYANETGETVEPEGMEKFCEDLGVEPENVVMLSIAYTLQAQQMGFFTESEWMMGMTALQCDSTVKLQNKLDHLKGILKDPVQFKNIFRYAFDFARDKDQRSMEIGTAKEMLGLLLGKQWSLFSSFNQYLEQSKFRVINKDQWQNVLEFSRLIRTDLSNYDEDGAWPVMLDEFVEWYREQGHGAASTSSTTTSPSSSHVPMS